MFTARGLSCPPDSSSGLNGVSIGVASGELITVTGPNGSGKTNLCRCLGLQEPRAEGRLELNGERVQGGPSRAARSGIIVLLKGQRVFSELTVRENLIVPPAWWRGGRRLESLKSVMSHFPELAGRGEDRAGNLSGGEQQMVAIARSLLASPRILVLDEPTLGLGPGVASRLFEILSIIRRTQPIGILVTAERMGSDEIEADRVYRMLRGKIIEETSLRRIKD